jgi:hypothetical protein
MKTLLAGRLTVALLFVLVQTNMGQAHFVWLRLDQHDNHAHAKLFFSESGDVVGEKLPESLAAARVMKRTAAADVEEITLSPIKSDDEVGLFASFDSSGDTTCLQTSVHYGLYHGTLLHYFAKAVRFSDDDGAAVATSKGHRLDMVPSWKEGNLTVTVVWDGTPAAGAEVTVVDPELGEDDYETGKDGTCVIPGVEPGLYSLRTNRTDPESAGEIDDETYQATSYYSTLTVVIPGVRKAAVANEASASDLAPLPGGLASFGAAVADGWLYVYSGHTGNAHEHSTDNLSKHFRRLNLRDGGAWESLPMQTPLQGLPLVAHGRMLYRIGGLHATNAPSESEELTSVDEVARYDPATKTWTTLPALPDGRSSHDAVVIGDKIYVVGGWKLIAEEDSSWHETALVMDLAAQPLRWEEIDAPFSRRALAAGTRDGKVFVVGGMNNMDEVDRSVDIFDPATGQWSDGPALPGEGMEGFGVSAWNLADDLFVSGSGGALYRLNDVGDAWEHFADVESRVFFIQ